MAIGVQTLRFLSGPLGLTGYSFASWITGSPADSPNTTVRPPAALTDTAKVAIACYEPVLRAQPSNGGTVTAPASTSSLSSTCQSWAGYPTPAPTFTVTKSAPMTVAGDFGRLITFTVATSTSGFLASIEDAAPRALRRSR